MRLAHITLALLCISAPAAADDQPSLPDWMAGCWETRDGDRWTDECWSSARAGMMMGFSRSGQGDEITEWETMRIVLDSPNEAGPMLRMAYIASPQGAPGTVFAWSPSDDEGVTFHDAAHDYPQRIRYWRDGERLNAEISLGDGSNAVRWSYQRIEE